MRWGIASREANKMANVWIMSSFIYFLNRIIPSRKHFLCKKAVIFFCQYLPRKPNQHWKLFGIFWGSSDLVIQVLETVHFRPENRIIFDKKRSFSCTFSSWKQNNFWEKKKFFFLEVFSTSIKGALKIIWYFL